MVTSSPSTSTSGLRKCLSATIPARQAQSTMFPASDRTWIVKRMCHTCPTLSTPCIALNERKTHPLPSKHAQALFIHRVAPSQDFVQHPS